MKKFRDIIKYKYNFFLVVKNIFILPKIYKRSKIGVKKWLDYCFNYQRIGVDKNNIDINSLDYFYNDWKNIKNIVSKPVFNRENIDEIIIKGELGNISAIIGLNENTTKWVIGLHGWTENKYLGLRLLNDFYKKGYNILSFDSFAHGLTYGNKTDIGYSTVKILDNIIKYIKDKFFASSIGLIGNSMGASTAILYIQNGLERKNINWVVADCGFADLLIQMRYKIQENEETNWPLISIGLCNKFKKETNTNIKKYSLIKKMKKISKVPILFIHPLGDTFINYEHSLWMYNCKIKYEKQIESKIWMPLGSEHVLAISTYQNQYFKKIEEFIDKF
ncbi:alpha/beta hydrolase [Spiroplasma endosymbiont of Aspidapion aeneum]|uniref:alpha/beta hydrolase n=1 Tax=Spiroplasma endosymbiont of Aspidapion aeneum TaxID=3066276 RepID=UPI00313AA916